MPNWVDNNVIIVFPDEGTMETVLHEIGSKDRPFDFNRIIPEDVNNPEYQNAEENNVEDSNGNNFNWYDWHCKFWGTKWNSCDCSKINKTTDLEVELYFATAWSVPEPVYKAFAEKYPTVSLYAHGTEEGYSFEFSVCVENGEFSVEYTEIELDEDGYPVEK